MLENLKLNPYLSYLERNDVVVIYLNYNYYFFRNQSGRFMAQLLINNNITELLSQAPKVFVDYLLTKNILLEEIICEPNMV